LALKWLYKAEKVLCAFPDVVSSHCHIIIFPDSHFFPRSLFHIIEAMGSLKASDEIVGRFVHWLEGFQAQAT
jgi:hypothetical protein